MNLFPALALLFVAPFTNGEVVSEPQITNNSFTANETEVNYYVDLITRETEKSRSYVAPTNASEYEANSTKIEEFGTYDFVLIGCGSSGSVIASRLTERNWSVLVLEAGTYENDFVDVSAMDWYVQSSQYNWGYASVPQTTVCLGMVDKRCPYPRGKAVGGSSLLAGQVYVRGNRKDFDRWEREGNPGWSYSDVLPYFIKSENARIDNAEPGYHGEGGPLTVEYYRPYSPHFYAFIEANLELGEKLVDYNGKEQCGVSKIQLNTNKGRRASASRAFIYPVLNRKNLKISTHSFVTKILINTRTKEAYGVQFNLNGTRYRVKASKEIILSAGSIGSAQLLMLSGIGPSDHLKNLKIPVIQNLDVGKTVDDHPTFYGFNVLSNLSLPTASLRQYVINYLNDFGPLSIPGNLQGIGYYESDLNDEPGVPDLEIIVIPPNLVQPRSDKNYSYTAVSSKALYGNIDNTSTFTLYITLPRPVSKGWIKLKSSDPFEYPLISSKFLSDKHDKDIETLYLGVKLALRLLETKPMRKINATFSKVVHPDCARFEYLSRDYWYCTIRHYTVNFAAPVSSCKMGPDRRNGAIVDAKFRVHGVKKLRVADASTMPFSLVCHPDAVAMMIGERAADFIKESYGA